MLMASWSPAPSSCVQARDSSDSPGVALGSGATMPQCRRGAAPAAAGHFGNRCARTGVMFRARAAKGRRARQCLLWSHRGGSAGDGRNDGRESECARAPPEQCNGRPGGRVRHGGRFAGPEAYAAHGRHGNGVVVRVGSDPASGGRGPFDVGPELLGQGLPEMRVRLDQACDIGQVFDALALPARRVRPGSDLAAQRVVE